MLVPVLGLGVVGVGLFLLKKKLGGGGKYVLEIQRPYSRKVAQGEKKMEIRSYIPKNIIGKTIEILETPRSILGSSLPDLIDPEDDECDYRLIGSLVVSGYKEYKTEAEFNADAALHLAPEEFNFQKCKPCFGWIIKQSEAYDLPKSCPILQRVQRSIFKVLDKMPEAEIM